MKKVMYWPVIGVFCVYTSCAPRVEEKQSVMSESASFCLNEALQKSTEIVAVEERPVTEQLTLSGKIEYNENDLVAFRSLLSGVVEQVDFELGDQVAQGQVLATIKSTQIQDLYQQKRYQENQIKLLEKQVKSKRALAEDGILAAPDVLAAEHALESAIIERDRVAESLSLYQAKGSDAFHILAPKDGYIIQKSISPGQNVTADSAPLFSISNLKEVWVMVNIYASNLRHVALGNHVKVRTVAYPEKFYKGKIDKIYNVFDDNEHVLKARVVLANPELDLMPGLSADIIIDLQNNAGEAFAIPNRSKVFSNNKEYVVVYRDSCDMEIRQISTVSYNEEYTFIQEQFTPNEHVIGSNALLIFEQLNQ